MLTTGDDDFRDAQATSAAAICLVGELLLQRRPEGDSPQRPRPA